MGQAGADCASCLIRIVRAAQAKLLLAQLKYKRLGTFLELCFLWLAGLLAIVDIFLPFLILLESTDGLLADHEAIGLERITTLSSACTSPVLEGFLEIDVRSK